MDPVKRCEGCEHSRKNSRDGIWCVLFGIMVHRAHEGCRYHREKAPEKAG